MELFYNSLLLFLLPDKVTVNLDIYRPGFNWFLWYFLYICIICTIGTILNPVTWFTILSNKVKSIVLKSHVMDFNIWNMLHK